MTENLCVVDYRLAAKQLQQKFSCPTCRQIDQHMPPGKIEALNRIPFLQSNNSASHLEHIMAERQNQIDSRPPPRPSSHAIVEALNKSEHVEDVVKECADELSEVNSILQKDTIDRLPLEEIDKALGQSQSIENKVTDCADDLAAVNDVLANEIRERLRLEQALTTTKRQEEFARHQASHDPLTGLPNRILFKDRLDHGLAQAKRHNWCIAVMFVDLDDFKGSTIRTAMMSAISC